MFDRCKGQGRCNESARGEGGWLSLACVGGGNSDRENVEDFAGEGVVALLCGFNSPLALSTSSVCELD